MTTFYYSRVFYCSVISFIYRVYW